MLLWHQVCLSQKIRAEKLLTQNSDLGGHSFVLFLVGQIHPNSDFGGRQQKKKTVLIFHITPYHSLPMSQRSQCLRTGAQGSRRLFPPRSSHTLHSPETLPRDALLRRSFGDLVESWSAADTRGPYPSSAAVSPPPSPSPPPLWLSGGWGGPASVLPLGLKVKNGFVLKRNLYITEMHFTWQDQGLVILKVMEEDVALIEREHMPRTGNVIGIPWHLEFDSVPARHIPWLTPECQQGTLLQMVTID